MRLTISKLPLPVLRSNGMTSVSAGSVNVIVPPRSALARDVRVSVMAAAIATPRHNCKVIPFFMIRLSFRVSPLVLLLTANPIETRSPAR